MSTTPAALRESLALLRDVARRAAADLARASARARATSSASDWRRCSPTRRSRCCRRRAISRCWAPRRRHAGADRLRRNPGRDDGARRAVPDDARQHRASDHRRAGHQHARRAQSAARARMRRRDPRSGGKRGRMPELWDGRAAERIADDLVRLASARHCHDAIGATTSRHGTVADVAQMNPRDAADGAIVNALTIDVEDYFQVSAFCRAHPAGVVGRACRAASSATSIASCSCLRMPTSARRSSRSAGSPSATPRWSAGSSTRGHELASHGYEHRRATDQGYGQFLADIRLAKAVLEDIVRRPGQGLSRAQLFGRADATPGRSSASPRPDIATVPACIRSGTTTTARPDAPRFAHEVEQGLLEVPITTVRLLRLELAGGRRRLFPAAALSACRAGRIRRVNAVDRQPAIFYFHPWELDPEQPRVNGPGRKARFRHYVNLERMESAAAAPAGRLPVGSRRPRVPVAPS